MRVLQETLANSSLREVKLLGQTLVSYYYHPRGEPLVLCLTCSLDEANSRLRSQSPTARRLKALPGCKPLGEAGHKEHESAKRNARD